MLGEVCSFDDYWGTVEGCELSNSDVCVVQMWNCDGFDATVGPLVYCNDESARASVGVFV